MTEHLIKTEYETLNDSDIETALKFIDGKCSEYYFIDYLRCTNGNVVDAIDFYLLDDKLRSLLTQYLIRFEIQLKTDFVKTVQDSTGSPSFWNNKRFFIPEARQSTIRGKVSSFTQIKKHIQGNLDRMSFTTMGPINYAAMYSSSFGTFQELYKLIDLPHKINFINKYTSHLNIHNYKILNACLESIRKIRNRCAHGNHIISLKLVNELNCLRGTLFSNNCSPNPNFHLTVTEATFIFIIKQLKCGYEFKKRLITLLKKYKLLLVKYNGKHCLSGNTIEKIS